MSSERFNPHIAEAYHAESNKDKPSSNTYLYFPGQGTQYVGMGEAAYNKYPQAKAIWDKADKELGYPLSEICFEDPHAQLVRTKYTQPGIFVNSYVNVEMMKALGKDEFVSNPPIIAGHSLGEYNAFVASGAMSFEDGLKLIQARADGMQIACDTTPGSMSSVLGVNEEQVRDILDGIKDVEIAVVNEDNSVVIGGTMDGLDKASEILKAAKKKVRPLEVDGAFHTSLMEPAQENLAKVLDSIDIQPPKISIVANTDTRILKTPSEIKDEAIRQLTSTVRWNDTVSYLKEHGYTRGFEPSEKAILSNIKKRTIGGAVTAMVIGGLTLGTVWYLHEHDAKKHNEEHE